MSTFDTVPCLAKHTDYQPPESKWVCVACGADGKTTREQAVLPGGLVIIESDETSHPDCTLIHPIDTIVCEGCKKSWSGTILARQMKKRDRRIQCPTCHGVGTVEDLSAP